MTVDLTEVLNPQYSGAASKQYKLPVAMGMNIFHELDYEDLSQMQHTAYTGSTGSGKSVGLQCLIMSLATFRSPEEVNLLIIDVGGRSLWCFGGLPHLSHPVIKDHRSGIYALTQLVAEMERRLTLSPEELDRLPAIVCVFDEFVSFVDNGDGSTADTCIHLVNSILRRARKVNIFLVLATQSPKQEYLKGFDLNNITTKVAFRNASRTNSTSALGCAGAENLRGKGDMIVDTAVYSDPLRLQGAYISEDEIIEQVKLLAEQPYDDSNKFVIPEFVPGEYGIDQAIDSIPKKSDDSDEKYAQVLMWTLAQTKVSANVLYNALGKKLRLGAKKFNPYLDRMCGAGFISEYNGTQPRKVLINSIEDLTEEQMDYLTKFGYTEEQLTKLFEKKNNA